MGQLFGHRELRHHLARKMQVCVGVAARSAALRPTVADQTDEWCPGGPDCAMRGADIADELVGDSAQAWPCDARRVRRRVCGRRRNTSDWYGVSSPPACRGPRTCMCSGPAPHPRRAAGVRVHELKFVRPSLAVRSSRQVDLALAPGGAQWGGPWHSWRPYERALAG